MISQPLSRRNFLQSAAAVSAGFAGLSVFAQTPPATSPAGLARVGYGPLEADPYGVLSLPKGFSYRVLARLGQQMDDGLTYPGKPDGAAAFPGPDRTTVLIVNHELQNNMWRLGPFGMQNELTGAVDRHKLFDAGHGRTPSLGGTTTIHFDTRTGEVTRRFMSLAGTERNCAGGPTPWNSWITCEETDSHKDDTREQDHGFCFEVPASATGPVDPVPLKAMGRFFHEAVAVDPSTGIVYLTEDRQDGVFYRFIPNVPGELVKGGQLQALALRDEKSADTRNWLNAITAEEAAKYAATEDHTKMNVGDHSSHRVPTNEPMDVVWLDVKDVLSPNDDLRHQCVSAGAAKFARGEGCWFGHQSVYFACTTGGTKRQGQIFRYVPSRFEGTPEEEKFCGQLELYLEPNDSHLLQNADNVTIAPWGDLIFCEDSSDHNDVVGVTPRGEYYKLASNTLSGSEFAGSCFSPDGSTLFVNIQGDGLVLAIQGPWGRRIAQ